MNPEVEIQLDICETSKDCETPEFLMIEEQSERKCELEKRSDALRFGNIQEDL